MRAPPMRRANGRTTCAAFLMAGLLAAPRSAAGPRAAWRRRTTAYDAGDRARHRQRHRDHPRQRDRDARPAAASSTRTCRTTTLLNGTAGPARRPGAAGRAAVGIARDRSADGEAAARERAARRARRDRAPKAAVADAVDDAAVQAAYDKQIAAFQPAPEFNAAHILVDRRGQGQGAARPRSTAAPTSPRSPRPIPATARPRRAATSAGSAPARWCPEFETAVKADAGRARSPGRSRPSSAGT